VKTTADDPPSNTDPETIAGIDALLAAEPELLSVYDLARLLHVHYNTVLLWLPKGQFPAPIALGPRLKRWPKTVVRHYLLERGGRKDGAA
jgi:predicted DNA-binding transcriptional regulator AlpA